MKSKRALLRYTLIGAICILFVLRRDIVRASLVRSAQMCLERLVPSLFPFMIAADLICRASGGSVFTQLLLGWIFGFPICAKAGSQLYAQGKISYSVFRMMICCGSIPSLPFTLGVCGSIFGNAEGVVLYFIALSSAIICIPHFSIESKGEVPSKSTKHNNTPFGEEVSEAISSCTERMLSICGYVCFFSLLCDSLSAGIESPLIKCILGGMLEFSGGVMYCKGLGDAGFVLCAAILSFSGLSAYMQILSVERSAGISSGGRDYLRIKSVQALMSAMAATGYVFRENIFGKVMLCLVICIFLCQFFRILQLIYRKRLNRIKSNNIMSIN